MDKVKRRRICDIDLDDPSLSPDEIWKIWREDDLSWMDDGESGEEGDSEPEPEPGPYFSPKVESLPIYVRHGHAMLLLRDLFIDELIVDGFSLGNPDAPAHPFFTGGFRGYFNVPFGQHTLVARWADQESTCKVNVKRNAVHIKRIHWREGGWVDDDPKTARWYRRLASSGAMLRSRALRPWPLPSLYVQNAPADLQVNGISIPGPAVLRGLLNLLPGEYVVSSASKGFSMRLELPRESRQVIDLGAETGSEFVHPHFGDVHVRPLCAIAPEGALMRAEAVKVKPSPALAPPATPTYDESIEEWALGGARIIKR